MENLFPRIFYLFSWEHRICRHAITPCDSIISWILPAARAPSPGCERCVAFLSHRLLENPGRPGQIMLESEARP